MPPGDAAEFWDREIVDPSHVSWMTDPEVRIYINQSISGSRHEWPMDWFQQRLARRKYPVGLSIGCGGGPLERDVLRRGICDRMDAFDGSPGSIEVAIREARAAGLEDRVRYSVADFNNPVLPRRHYDIVFFHQSLHHVGKLEKVFRAVLRTLKPDGLLYLDEYVGPSRGEWSDRLMTTRRSVFQMVPADRRRSASLALPNPADDPSEAIRSAEILPQLTIGFEIESQRDYGGNLLSILHPAIRWDDSEESAILIRQLVAAEKELLTREPSYYSIILARPRGGIRGMAASLRYFVAPKWRRLGREVRQRTTRPGRRDRRRT
jgi:SAM-dependent methyltransferase